MLLPRWIPFVVAAWVIAFGIMRLRIALRKEKGEGEPNFRKRGYYARSRASHAVFGVAYLILGGLCIAMGFGFSFKFFGGCLGKKTVESAPHSEPNRDQGVPVTLPGQ